MHGQSKRFVIRKMSAARSCATLVTIFVFPGQTHELFTDTRLASPWISLAEKLVLI
jgi:hypothetical protein